MGLAELGVLRRHDAHRSVPLELDLRRLHAPIAVRLVRVDGGVSDGRLDRTVERFLLGLGLYTIELHRHRPVHLELDLRGLYREEHVRLV